MMEGGEYIQVSLACRNLKNMDFLLDKSDPYIKVSMSSAEKGMFTFVGRTETKFNELNPNFDTVINIPYFFEKRQFIRFDIYDQDSKDGRNDDFLGFVQTEVSKMMGSDKQTLILDVKLDGQNCGKLITRCDSVKEGSVLLTMEWRGVGLVNTDSYFDFWDKSDPYLKFLRKRADGTKIVVHTTEVINNSLNPVWRPCTFNLDRLTGGDPKQKFIVECWDHEDEAAHQYIGSLELTLEELRAKSAAREQLKLSSEKYSKPGALVCDRLLEQRFHTFVQYLRGGLKLELTVNIDFTGSNGDPRDYGTLHYINPAQPNRYQKALHSVCEILLSYSPSSSLIPAYGFGAKLPGRSEVNHCFPLSLNPGQQAAENLPSLLAMYSNSLMKVTFSGPTLFAPILNRSTELAKQLDATNPFVYTVMLILTDGVINDMDATIDAIYNASLLPLSIIIVGIGDADFSNMQKLDGDSGLYNSKGQLCPRDIVQFVPFNSVANDKERLRENVLAELPRQVEQYYRFKKIPPPQAQYSDPNELIKTPGFKLDQLLAPMLDPKFIGGTPPPEYPAHELFGGYGYQIFNPLADPKFYGQPYPPPYPQYQPQIAPPPTSIPQIPGYSPGTPLVQTGPSGMPLPGQLSQGPRQATQAYDYPLGSAITDLLNAKGPALKGDIQ